MLQEMMCNAQRTLLNKLNSNINEYQCLLIDNTELDNWVQLGQSFKSNSKYASLGQGSA